MCSEARDDDAAAKARMQKQGLLLPGSSSRAKRGDSTYFSPALGTLESRQGPMVLHKVRKQEEQRRRGAMSDRVSGSGTSFLQDQASVEKIFCASLAYSFLLLQFLLSLSLSLSHLLGTRSGRYPRWRAKCVEGSCCYIQSSTDFSLQKREICVVILFGHLLVFSRPVRLLQQLGLETCFLGLCSLLCWPSFHGEKNAIVYVACMYICIYLPNRQKLC